VATRPLDVRPGDLALRSWSPSTLDAYNADWRWFTAWCDVEAGLDDPLEADEHVVAEYVAAMVRDRLAYATIGRRLAAIAFVFDVVARRPSPSRSRLVRRVVRGAARTLGAIPRGATPLTLAEFRRIVHGLALMRPAPTRRTAVQRDQLLFALGWAAALRPGELVALDLDDLDLIGDPNRGDAGILVRIRRSKGDRRGRTETVAVPCASDAASCPVRLALVAIRRQNHGPLFVQHDRYGNTRGRLGANAVSRIVKGAVADILGLDPTPIADSRCAPGTSPKPAATAFPTTSSRAIPATTASGCSTSTTDPPADLTVSAFGAWW
jgi:integrase